MTYEQAVELKRIMSFDINGNPSKVIVDNGVEYEFYVTPFDEADLKLYVNMFNPKTFTDFSATVFSSNKQFRLHLIGMRGTDKILISIDINKKMV